jgi:hypothetical protein
VEIVVDAGGAVRAYEVAATRAGRRVDISQARAVIVVSELTRNGTPVRTARFMANRVIALVEHPVDRPVERARASADGEAGTPVHPPAA